MNYTETLEYLRSAMPSFQEVGAGAYKPGLERTTEFCRAIGSPHRNYFVIHIAGTNGKGSVANMLAAVLQQAGYQTGLYTSPHLVDFRERIRVNGEMISQERVVKFVESERDFFEPLHPSFFELTTALAFKYFEEAAVDIAVIETGLGGRLDCTNIISPDLTVITNISFDHVGFLGDTLAKIAHEKAGIIKPHTPIIIGEHNEETRPVFETEAAEKQAPITFAQDTPIIVNKGGEANYDIYQTISYSNLQVALRGYCQEKNVNTLLHAISELQRIGYNISEEAVRKGFAHVCQLTGLMGRWQQLNDSPRLICDTGHNIGGFQYIVPQILAQPCKQLRIVFGMVNDKDITSVLAMMPTNARYYFTQASIKRAMRYRQRLQPMVYKESVTPQCSRLCRPQKPTAWQVI